MRRIALLLTLFATALACLLHAVPAQAQPIRVFVALTGADANPCTFALPCKSAQHAHDVVAAGGEMRMLDPGSYGLITITKAISILGNGHGGIAASNGATAITINAGATDKISLRGLVIEGFGTGQTGIVFNAGASLTVQDSVIRNFAGDGIDFLPSLNQFPVIIAASLVVSNTVVSENGGDGVLMKPPSFGSAVEGTFTRVESRNNAGSGFHGDAFVANSPSVAAIFYNSVVTANGTAGFFANADPANTGGNSPSVVFEVFQCAVIFNGINTLFAGSGFKASGPHAQIRFGGTVVHTLGNDVVATNGASVLSYGDNYPPPSTEVFTEIPGAKQ